MYSHSQNTILFYSDLKTYSTLLQFPLARSQQRVPSHCIAVTLSLSDKAEVSVCACFYDTAVAIPWLGFSDVTVKICSHSFVSRLLPTFPWSYPIFQHSPLHFFKLFLVLSLFSPSYHHLHRFNLPHTTGHDWKMVLPSYGKCRYVVLIPKSDTNTHLASKCLSDTADLETSYVLQQDLPFGLFMVMLCSHSHYPY